VAYTAKYQTAHASFIRIVGFGWNFPCTTGKLFFMESFHFFVADGCIAADPVKFVQ